MLASGMLQFANGKFELIPKADGVGGGSKMAVLILFYFFKSADDLFFALIFKKFLQFLKNNFLKIKKILFEFYIQNPSTLS